MKKTQLILLLLLSAICIQSCKKDVITSASTTSDKILSANINGTAWNPDTVSAAITYNAATKTKTFSVVGIALQKQVSLSVAVPNSTNTTGFPFATFKVDSTKNNVKMVYSTQALIGGSFTPAPGKVEGSVITTAIDSVKKVITGTYSFSVRQLSTDINGNESITTQQIQSGSFTNLPYTFVSN
ncbi:hypothetical protein [Mucilaginibacter sp. RCC_168]|uniref:hypothetical protein n=1 Tax=unclassified Mucilaginibacter TaxID=2617802 RepID=UPI003525AFD8